MDGGNGMVMVKWSVIQKLRELGSLGVGDLVIKSDTSI